MFKIFHPTYENTMPLYFQVSFKLMNNTLPLNFQSMKPIVDYLEFVISMLGHLFFIYQALAMTMSNN